MGGHGAEAASTQWGGSTFRGRKKLRNLLHSRRLAACMILHTGLRGVIGTYEGRNHSWEGRNLLLTCGFEGRNRNVRGAKHRWEGGHTRGVSTDGRCVIPGLEEQGRTLVTGNVVSWEFVHMGSPRPLLVFE